MTGWLSGSSAPHTSPEGGRGIFTEPRVSPIIALDQVPPSWQTERPWKCARPQESPPLAWRGEIWLCPFHVDEPGEIHRRVPANDLCHFFFLTAATSCLCCRWLPCVCTHLYFCRFYSIRMVESKNWYICHLLLYIFYIFYIDFFFCDCFEYYLEHWNHLCTYICYYFVRILLKFVIKIKYHLLNILLKL